MFQPILRVACACLLAGAFQASAAPYTPGSDSQVLERLPLKPGDPVARELRSLRSALATRPGDPALAGALAQKYFDLAMAEGDPRYIGYAEGVLRPWASANGVPPGLRVIRALLRQYKHDFAGALGDLASALEADPANLDARAWRAAIFMVQARYPEARAECAALVPHSSDLFSAGCLAYVDATTGKARAAHDRLAAVLQRSHDASAQSRLWNLTRLAEMARRLGEPARAEQYFRAALSVGITDNFLLAAYADFLLDERRPAEAAALLKDWARSDTLLLRLAFAEQALGLPGAAQRIQALEDRFSESGLRGEQLHLQEEARFRLHLKKDPARALRLAAENWKKQREPRDAAILLEAALAAGERAAAQPALDWLEQSGFEDAGMRRTAGLVKALPK